MRGISVRAACALLALCPAAAHAYAPDALPQRPIIVTGNVGPNMNGTYTAKIRAERFSGSWQQALEDASRSPALNRLIAPARQLSRGQQIAFVQRAVHANVRWISDATQWGQHDYWASASQTLIHGAGDMEDRAIVKMHALKALGFSPSDLFLTLGRDRVGGPVTVLTVRSAGRYYILDDTGGAPFAVDQRRFEFQPILSFSWGGAWVHSTPRNQAIAARTSQSGSN